MSQGGSERSEMLGHPLADKFRDVVVMFGGTGTIADSLLLRLQSLQEDHNGILSADIRREVDLENGIASSWVRLEFNPHTEGLISTVFLGGLVKRELSKDVLNKVTRVHMPDKETVIFENDRGRMLWLDSDGLIMTTPS